MPQANNPAGVSGPGAMSRRTDGGPAQKLATLPDAQYGENATFQGLQQNAPLAQSGQTPQGEQQFQPNPAAGAVVPFSAPTQRPNEPVTTGATEGAGAGPESLGIHPAQAEQQDMGQLAKHMPLLEAIANLHDVTESSRLWVNLINANS